ncbi:hypothetical protein PAXRUDRAFT_19562 [Paxillus rubicundulus Ve08.2h10]|uniref:Uncharacterized protein n=1 Tax=Paxillus rubicundulus Ve08.2h10 TaxID=930991 RepID=A0A0D0CHR6_9AGAM|nr:hypothetical protein PAXRUDRAFT_19562 [Paxillus rubicundulus Ve08.2h10]
MDLMLSQLESLVHYTSIHLMTIQSELSHTCLMPLDAVPEPYASFWLQELHVTRRVVTLMAVRGLPHCLPGPLWALGPQFIATELDRNEAHITILHGMKRRIASLGKMPGGSLDFRPSFRLGQLPVLRLRLMRRELTEAYEAGRRVLLDMEHYPTVPPSIPSPFIPVYAMQQADGFAEMLALAYNNPGGSVMLSAWTTVLIIPVVINIDAKRVQEALNAHDYGTNAKREADLLRRFNMPEIPPIMGPTVLIDTAGIVLLWSLPEVLSSHFQASTACPEVLATLKARNPDQGSRDWLEQMMVPSAVLSAAMAIMHPNLYTAGREAVIRLYQDLAMPHSDDPAFAEMA